MRDMPARFIRFAVVSRAAANLSGAAMTSETASNTEKRYYTVKVLDKALDVIAVMAAEPRWELDRLAQVTGLPKSSLHRILLTLAERGYVSRERGRYALSLEFYRLGQRIAANNAALLEQARPFCRRLMRAVNETVNLCVARNTEMVIVDQQMSAQKLRLDATVGYAFPIFRSASGKAWCAFLDELRLLRLLEDIRRDDPEVSQAAVDGFMDELIAVRSEGVAFDREESHAGVRCVSAPVFDGADEAAAVVTCSVPSARLNEQSSGLLVREIADCAARISQALGARPRRFAPPSAEALLAEKTPK